MWGGGGGRKEGGEYDDTEHFHGEHILGGLPKKILKTCCSDMNSGGFWAPSRIQLLCEYSIS